MTINLDQIGNLLTTGYGIIGLIIFAWTLIVTTWALLRLPTIQSQLKELPQKISKLASETDRLDSVLSKFTETMDDLKVEIAEIVKRIEAVSAQVSRINDSEITSQDPQAPLPTESGSNVDKRADVGIGREEVDSGDHWPNLVTLWARIKEDLNSRIDGIEDGRVRRKYAVRKNDYSYVIGLLFADGLIGDRQVNGAIYLNDLYLARRNRRNPVTDDEMQQAIEAAEPFDRPFLN